MLEFNASVVLAAAVVTAATTESNVACAQSAQWRPGKPVTIVVPYAAGGGTDAVARAVARQLGVIWNQPVVVENLPGADGLIGTRRVIDSRPDGTTLLFQVPAIVLTKYTPGLKGVDPLQRLQPITAVAQTYNAVVISGKVPVKTMAEFVAHCQRAGQRCSLGTTDTLGRLYTRQLVSESGLTDTVIVNYRGTGAVMTDLISNNVNMSFTSINPALPHSRTGAVRFLATTGDERASALPEVPTVQEAGFGQYRSITWYGLFAPAGVPAPVTRGILAALRKTVQDADVQKTFVAASIEAVVSSTLDFAAQLHAEEKRLGALVSRYPLE